MFERTRIESASVRRLVADRAWGHAGAVGGVQRSEAYILGAKAGGGCGEQPRECSIQSPTDKEERDTAV